MRKPQRKGADIPHAKNKPVEKNENTIVPLQPHEDFFKHMLQFWVTAEKFPPIAPPDPESNLIAAKTSCPGKKNKRFDVENVLCSGSASENHESLALQEGPDKNNRFKPAPVVLDEVLQIDVLKKENNSL